MLNKTYTALRTADSDLRLVRTCNVTRLRYAVTLQVCTHPYTALRTAGTDLRLVLTCNVTRLRYAVTLQVCTHTYTALRTAGATKQEFAWDGNWYCCFLDYDSMFFFVMLVQKLRRNILLRPLA